MLKLFLLAALVAITIADVSHLSKGNKKPISRLPVAPKRLPVAPSRRLPVAPAPSRRLPVAPAPSKRLPVAPAPARRLPVAPSSTRPGQEIAILKSESNVNPDGSYQYAYETANGIAAQEQGQQVPVGKESANSVQGSYQYSSPEGVPIVVQYIADENGYQPSSDILPTPPPVPYAILRALEWIAAHPQQEDKPTLRRF